MQTLECTRPDGRVIYIPTIEAMLNGNQRTIIPAKSKYSMSGKSSNKIASKIETDQLLPSIFCFTKSEIFTEVGEPLYTLTGEPLPTDVDFGCQVLVYLDKADNIQLLDREDLGAIQATIVECKSVQDAVSKMAASAYLSQTPSKNDWLGYAGANDVTASMIKAFADKHHIQGTVAQAYFGVNEKTSVIQNMAIFGHQHFSGARSLEQATTLIEAVAQAFSAKRAGQTRYLKGVNYCIKEYGLDIVVKALNNIGGKEKLQMEVSSCEEKAFCLQNILINQISEINKNQPNSQTEVMAQAS